MDRPAFNNNSLRISDPEARIKTGWLCISV
jgi:hypothetical protein